MIIATTSSIAIDQARRRPTPGRRDARKKPSHHRQDVAHRVEDAVAVVVERDRRLAVAIDDDVGVLEDLPARLEQHRQRAAAAPTGQRRPTSQSSP